LLPSRSLHCPAQYPCVAPGDFAQVPPRRQSLSSVQGNAGSPGQACDALHCQRVKTTRMSRQPYPRGHDWPSLQSAPQYVELVRVSMMQKLGPRPQVSVPPPEVQRAQYGRRSKSKSE
jgi:hypothetical protein